MAGLRYIEYSDVLRNLSKMDNRIFYYAASADFIDESLRLRDLTHDDLLVWLESIYNHSDALTYTEIGGLEFRVIRWLQGNKEQTFYHVFDFNEEPGEQVRIIEISYYEYLEESDASL